MSRLLNDDPLYIPINTFNPNQILKDKGQQIMKGMLLDQYQNSPNLQEYFMAFIAELDLLFEQTSSVYFGRLLQNAVGAQLDVIGIILGQSRNIRMEQLWFGFQGAPDVDGFAPMANPAQGGVFRSKNQGEAKVTPLDDSTYRRVLLAKAAVSNRDTADLDLAYFVISTLLNRVPSIFELNTSESVFTNTLVNGDFSDGLSGWEISNLYGNAMVEPVAAGVMVTPSSGSVSVIEQEVPVRLLWATGNYNVKLNYNSEGNSACRIMVGTASEPTRYHTSDHVGSGTLDINFSPDLRAPVYIRIGSVGTGTWSSFGNVSIINTDVVPARTVELVVSRNDVSTQELQLINYMAKYFVPSGMTFTNKQV